jgi:hypothetical protein
LQELHKNEPCSVSDAYRMVIGWLPLDRRKRIEWLSFGYPRWACWAVFSNSQGMMPHVSGTTDIALATPRPLGVLSGSTKAHWGLARAQRHCSVGV